MQRRITIMPKKEWGFDSEGDVTIFLWFVSFTIYKTSIVWHWGNKIVFPGTKQLYYSIGIVPQDQV
jgi:hypothetical protein